MEDEKKSLRKVSMDLTNREREEYLRWQQKENPPIPLADALKLYELFLNSYTCEEIHRVNGHKYELGAVVDARMRYDWDSRKETQVQNIYGTMEEKVLRVKNEAVAHVADMMVAAHKLHGDKIKQFIQSGDEELVKDLKIHSLKDYQEIIKTFMLLTGDSESPTKVAKGKVDVSGKVEHVHKVEEAVSKKANDFLRLVEASSEVIDGEKS